MQQFGGLRLIAAALVQRGSDQLNLVAFDFVVEVDTVVIEVDWFVVVVSGGELRFQRFDLTSERFRKHDELIDATLHVGIAIVGDGLVLQDLHGEDLTPNFQRDSVR